MARNRKATAGAARPPVFSAGLSKKVLAEIERDLVAKARAEGLEAYHQVMDPADLDRILEGGEIVPAGYRLDPVWVVTMCGAWLEDLALRYPGRSLDALDRLVGKAIRSLEEFRAAHGIIEKAALTRLECVDLIFGDAKNVYLSLGGFIFAGVGMGLMFDAFDLVDRGAAVRMEDFIYGYRDVVDRAVRMDYDVGAILKEIRQIQDTELRGRAAERKLALAHGNLDELMGMEIVWKGPLPAAWATEIGRIEGP